MVIVLAILFMAG